MTAPEGGHRAEKTPTRDSVLLASEDLLRRAAERRQGGCPSCYMQHPDPGCECRCHRVRAEQQEERG